MPSSGRFARIALITAVAAVVAISTLGPLLKQVGPRQGNAGPIAIVNPLPSEGSKARGGDTALIEPAAIAMPVPDLAVSTATARAEPAVIPRPEPSASVPAAALAAFPPVQTLADEGPAGLPESPAQAAQQPAPAAATEAPAVEKPAAAPRRASDNRPARRKPVVRQSPQQVRESLAGQW